MGNPKDIENLRANREKIELTDAQLNDLRRDVKKIIDREEAKEQNIKLTELERIYGASLHV